MAKKGIAKKMVNVRFPVGLLAWVKKYAASQHTTMTQLILDHFTDLKEQETHARQI